MSKQVGIDLRCLPADGSEGAGVAHASRELWSALIEASDAFNVSLHGFVPRGAHVDQRSTIVWLNDSSGGELRRALRTHPVDAMFIAHGAAPLGLSVPSYPWVHDLAIFSHPEWFPQPWLKRQLTTRLFLRGLRRAPMVFAVSEDTKRQVEKIAHVSPEWITVTLEGVRQKTLGIQSQTPYVLILGTVEPRKNIPFIVSLWPEVCRQFGQTVNLVIAGKEGWGNVPIDHGQPGLIRQENVTDEEHDRLIAQASIVLVPSQHEGFGRTALEAVSFGVPTIVSDRGALPEVVGEAGLVIPLEQPAEWAKNIVAILKNREIAQQLRQDGLERASQFSWDQTARIILAKMAVG